MLYSFIDAWDGLVYAGILVEELAQFINRPSRWLHQLSDEHVEPESHPVLTGSFAIKLASVSFHLDAMPSKLSSTDADIPLGRTYGIRTLNDASSLRRQLGRQVRQLLYQSLRITPLHQRGFARSLPTGEILGGLREPPGKVDLVGCARR